jgi:hypothetical protein
MIERFMNDTIAAARLPLEQRMLEGKIPPSRVKRKTT